MKGSLVNTAMNYSKANKRMNPNRDNAEQLNWTLLSATLCTNFEYITLLLCRDRGFSTFDSNFKINQLMLGQCNADASQERYDQFFP